MIIAWSPCDGLREENKCTLILIFCWVLSWTINWERKITNINSSVYQNKILWVSSVKKNSKNTLVFLIYIWEILIWLITINLKWSLMVKYYLFFLETLHYSLFVKIQNTLEIPRSPCRTPTSSSPSSRKLYQIIIMDKVEKYLEPHTQGTPWSRSRQRPPRWWCLAPRRQSGSGQGTSSQWIIPWERRLFFHIFCQFNLMTLS